MESKGGANGICKFMGANGICKFWEQMEFVNFGMLISKSLVHSRWVGLSVSVSASVVYLAINWHFSF